MHMHGYKDDIQLITRTQLLGNSKKGVRENITIYCISKYTESV